MYNHYIKKHDNFQFEIKKNYIVQKQKNYSKYYVETYFFVPQSLNINPRTYSRQQFAIDSQTYIRLQTPPVHLENLNNSNLWQKLYKAFDSLNKEKGKARYKRQVKMFCSIFKSSLRDYVTDIINSKPENLLEQAEDYTKVVKTLLKKFRDLEESLNKAKIRQKEEKIFLFADEYLSLIVGKYTFKFYNHLLANDIDYKDLLELIKSENEYRKQNNYEAILSFDDNNEDFLYRRSVLKKYFASVLFLRSKKELSKDVFEHILFSLAAGVAMIVATVISFFYRTKFGGYTPSLFFVLVISYMLKDRIKDIFRYYFTSMFSSWLFDYNEYILDSYGQKLGISREAIDFLNEGQLGNELHEKRAKDIFKDFSSGWGEEDIIRYRKYIKINSKKITESEFEVQGLTDIFRFNIRHFLNSMDNPEQQLFICNENNCTEIFATRTYKVMIIILSKIDGKKSYEKFWLVLNRDGIIRIEMV